MNFKALGETLIKMSVPTTPSSPKDVLLILPCWNEEDALSHLLPEILRLFDPRQVLVVDDGSTDGTAAVARAHGVFCVRLVQNCGIGGAVQTGFRFALQEGFQSAVQIDGDGQHPPDQIAKLLAEARQSSADLVVGSRFLGECSFRSSRSRRVGIRLISFFLAALFRIKVADTTSGMRLYGPRALALYARLYPMDYPEPISLALASERKLVIREVPVLMRERLGGLSSIVGLHAIRYMVRVLGYLILIRLGRHI